MCTTTDAAVIYYLAGYGGLDVDTHVYLTSNSERIPCLAPHLRDTEGSEESNAAELVNPTQRRDAHSLCEVAPSKEHMLPLFSGPFSLLRSCAYDVSTFTISQSLKLLIFILFPLPESPGWSLPSGGSPRRAGGPPSPRFPQLAGSPPCSVSPPNIQPGAGPRNGSWAASISKL